VPVRRGRERAPGGFHARIDACSGQRVSMDRTRPLSHIAVAVIGFAMGAGTPAPTATVPCDLAVINGTPDA